MITEIKSMLDFIDNDLTSSASVVFDAILSNKVQARLSEEKQVHAKVLFNNPTKNHNNETDSRD